MKAQQKAQRMFHRSYDWHVWLALVCPFLEAHNGLLIACRRALESALVLAGRGCSPDQLQVLFRICCDPRRFRLITGGPGTGKTYLLRTAQEFLEKNLGIPTHICAYTALAALNANGTTIHRSVPLFKLVARWDPINEKPTMKAGLFKVRFRPKTHLFIDEVSMVDPVIFEQIMFFMHNDVRITCFGDFRQLAPVKPLTDRTFFFETHRIKEFTLSHLRTSHRQHDAYFCDILRLMADNDYQNEDVRQFVRSRQQAFRALNDHERKGLLRLHQDNASVDAWNLQCFEELRTSEPVTIPVQVETVWEMESDEDKRGKKRKKTASRLHRLLDFTDLSLSMMEELLPDLKKALEQYRVQEVKLKEQCIVMFTRNIYRVGCYRNVEEWRNTAKVNTCDIVNGMRARVLRIYAEGVLLWMKISPKDSEEQSLFFPLRTHEVNFYTRYDAQLGTKTTRFAMVKYYPLMLCYAITVHKSQGLTLDSVVIHLTRKAEPNLAYVAFSRCRSSKDVFIAFFEPPMATFDPRILAFDKVCSEAEIRMAH